MKIIERLACFIIHAAVTAFLAVTFMAWYFQVGAFR